VGPTVAAAILAVSTWPYLFAINVPLGIVTMALGWRMLPHTTLGRQMAGKLKVYAGPEHPHEAQQPKPMEIQR